MPPEEARALATGTRFLVLVVFGILLLLAALDFYWELRRDHSLGHRLQEWSRRYPLYGIAVLALVGALLSHFFWQEFRAP